MIDVNDLRKGTCFLLDGELFKVLEYTHNKPGRGNATIRVRIVNLRSGAQFERTFQSGNRVEDVTLDKRPAQFLYQDGDFYNFMDMETYEQFALGEKLLGEQAGYLKEGLQVKIVLLDDEPLDVELPVTVDLRVVDSPRDIAGDTAAGGGVKVVTLETGLKVTAPLFVNQDDVLRIDTRTGQYVMRI